MAFQLGFLAQAPRGGIGRVLAYRQPNPLPVFPPLQLVRALDVPFFPAMDLDHIRLDMAIGR
jgi:hypothetical protein